MNLIKLSLILYPSCPGPGERHPITWSERIRWVQRQIEKEFKTKGTIATGARVNAKTGVFYKM